MDLGLLALFLAGGALLVAGAEALVRGASRLALAAGISPLVVGLTVVAFGTSAPELAVTVGSALDGAADVALGNVVGSNVFNVLFILGLAAVVRPLVVEQRLVRLDVPLVVLASVLVLVFSLDGTIGRLDGAVLAAGVVAYTVFLIRTSRRETKAVVAEYEEAFAPPDEDRRRPFVDVALLVGGLVGLVIGSDLVVTAAVDTATAMGISELVVGLTIVAAGTSLPEVATSVTATLRGERDIAVGNVVGSCLFNLLAVLGFGSLLARDGLAVAAGAVSFDLPVMTAVAVTMLPIFVTGMVARWQGAVLLTWYLGWTTWLVLDATAHDLAEDVGAAMIFFVVPLTAVALVAASRRRPGVSPLRG